jgi:hypothetical protein
MMAGLLTSHIPGRIPETVAGHQVARAVCIVALLVFLNIIGHLLSHAPAPYLLGVAYLITGNVNAVNMRNRKMPEPRVSLDDAAILLRCSARTLFKTVEFVLPEVKESLSPITHCNVSKAQSNEKQTPVPSNPT